MSCKDLKENFDDYVDETLEEAVTAQLRQHVASCDACQQLVDREHRLRDSLREYGDSSMPAPDATYFDRALITAKRQGLKRQHKRSWITGFGSAVAAGLAVWLLSGVLIDAPNTGSTDSAIPTVTMGLRDHARSTSFFHRCVSSMVRPSACCCRMVSSWLASRVKGKSPGQPI